MAKRLDEEALLKILDECSDFGDSDDSDVDKTYVPSDESDDEYDVLKIVKKRRSQINSRSSSLAPTNNIDEPGTTEPGTSGPSTSYPGTSEPGTSEAGTSEPGILEPGILEPGTSEPGTSEPGTSEPSTSQSGRSQEKQNSNKKNKNENKQKNVKKTKTFTSKKIKKKGGRNANEKKSNNAKSKNKQKWKIGDFVSKPFQGALDQSQIQNPDPVKLPSEYFKNYFPDDFFTKAATYTNMYSVKTTGRSINTTAHELKIFFGVNLLMGCFRFPRLRLYWQRAYSLPGVTEFMSRDRFLLLRNLFHLVDTANPTTDNNRLWKIQPIIDAVKAVCLRLPRDHICYSIDEQMIPFTGRCPVRQFVKNKPRPVGLKVFVVTSSSGLVLDFLVYQGNTTQLNHQELGLGPSVVMTLLRTIPANSFAFFDRYFTSVPLLEKLLSIGIEGTGTIMGNRVNGIEVEEDENVTALKRGCSNQFVLDNNKAALVEWQDTKKVLMASTAFGTAPVENVQRWSKLENKHIDVPCPAVVRNYNKCMGGVDVFNQQMECYRTFFKTRKWTWKVMAHFLDFAVVNSWMTYIRDAKANKLPKKQTLDLLAFRLVVQEWLVNSPKVAVSRAVISESEGEEEQQEPAVKRSKFFNPPVKMPAPDLRFDQTGHFPIVDNISAPRACRLEGCKSRSKVKCEKCKTYLCLTKQNNCFKLFHSK